MAKRSPDRPTVLGEFLTRIREANGLTLRQVEEATGKDVSNAYLSQLEHGKVSKPSPNILHSLSAVYGVSYENLMSKAGYISPNIAHTAGNESDHVTTFAIEDLSEEEEKALLAYLAIYRKMKGKN